jgi:hypothetical protein
MLALYHQDVTQNGKPKSYERLLAMVNVHLADKRLKDNREALASKHTRGDRATAARSGSPVKTGDCRQFARDGKCSRGKDCPWNHPKRERTASPKGKGKGKDKGKGKGKGKDKGKRDRSRSSSPEGRGVRTSAGSESKPKPCHWYLKGDCKKGKDCTLLHCVGFFK